MKKLIYTTIFILAGVSLFAQRIDLDKLSFYHKYTRVPDIYVDPEFATYSVHVQKTVALDHYSNESVTNKINIEGRKKVYGMGHIQVNINMQDLIIESSKVDQRVETYKDKDGTEKKRSYYKVVIVYSFQAAANVKDYLGNHIITWGLAGYSDKKNYQTKEYNTYSEAQNFYNNNNLEIKTQLVSGQINEAISKLNSNLSYALAYKTVTANEIFWVLGSKKHVEYAAYNEACNNAKAALETITCNEIPEGINEKLQSSITYFEKLAESNSDPEDKAQKKLRYGAYFNLAGIYYYTEQFEQAEKYANLLIKNDYDSKDGERLIKEMDGVLKDFEKHGIPSRHFYRDVQDAQAPQI